MNGNDCLLVYEDGHAEPVPGATWDPDKNGWHIDPPLAMKHGTRIMSRHAYTIELLRRRDDDAHRLPLP